MIEIQAGTCRSWRDVLRYLLLCTKYPVSLHLAQSANCMPASTIRDVNYTAPIELPSTLEPNPTRRASHHTLPAMASGYGLHGGPGRCFPFWQEVLACYVVNTSSEDDTGKKKCAPILEDYYECLHHKKEAARVRQLQTAYRKAEASSPRDNAPSAGQIRNLGLLDKEEDTKKVLGR
ncbi:hypothetical protein F5X97DRAFT_32350 [Nemania serpens]|nr:hypothetical protein F5X97DRAFT_32350 [Nemania serpens]